MFQTTNQPASLAILVFLISFGSTPFLSPFGFHHSTNPTLVASQIKTLEF